MVPVCMDYRVTLCIKPEMVDRSDAKHSKLLRRYTDDSVLHRGFRYISGDRTDSYIQQRPSSSFRGS